MGLGIGAFSKTAYGNISYSSNNDYDSQNNYKMESKSKSTAVARTMKRMLQESRQDAMNPQKSNGMLKNQKSVNDVFSYSESIRNARTKAKDTSLQLKKLRYNFKSISSKILRSKTSTSAKQVASQARREVIRLKRQRQNGEYDDEELQSAIVHAQAMERVAKKKARHLQEEEMIKAAGGACLGELEEKESLEEANEADMAQDELNEDELAADDMEGVEMEGSDSVNYDIASYEGSFSPEDFSNFSYQEELMQALTESLSEETYAFMEEQMSEMMSDLFENMKDLLSDMGLDELTDGIMPVADKDMDPADFKMMKIKHRNREMKDIVKADSEYLKALFDQMSKGKGAHTIDLKPTAATGGGVIGGSSGAGSIGSAGNIIDCVAQDVSIQSGDIGFDMSI